MAQQIKALAAKPDGPSSIPSTHMSVGLSVCLSLTHTHTHKINTCNSNVK